MSLGGREEPEKQTDIDRRFAEIVAQFESDEARWDTPDEIDEAAEADEGSDGQEPPTPAAEEGGAQPPVADLPAQWRMPPTGSASFLDDDDETFVPPPPRPLPSSDEDIGFWTMVGCLVGGPLWLLYLFFFDRYAQSLWWVLACALFVAGVVQLVLRSPKNRDDDPGDDGAVL